MKLPQILATQPIPAAMPAGRAQGTGFGAAFLPLQAAASGLTRAADMLAQVEEQKRKVAVAGEVSDLASKAELDLGTFGIELGRTERDPEAYLQKWGDYATELRTSLLEQTTYPESRAALTTKFNAFFADQALKARKVADGLFVDRQEATLDTTLDRLAQLAGSTALADPGTFIAKYRDGLDAIGGQVTVLGEKKAVDLAQKFRERLFYERGRRQVEADPQGFLTEVESGKLYRELSPERRDSLTQRATNLIDQRERQALAAEERQARALQHQFEADAKAKVAELDAKAADRTLTLGELEHYRTLRAVDGDNYRRLRTILDNPKDAPSDPGALQDATIAVYRVNPTISQRHLQGLFEAGKLSTKDYQSLSSHLTVRLDHARSETRTVANQRQAQAEQVLREGLGITGPFDTLSLTPVAKNLVALSTRELTDRSNAFDGKEDPIEAARDILARLGPIREQQVGLSAENLRQTLRYPTPDALEAARNAGQITGPAYETERRKFLDLKAAEQRAAEAAQRRKATGNNLGRTPKTPVQVGPVE